MKKSRFFPHLSVWKKYQPLDNCFGFVFPDDVLNSILCQRKLKDLFFIYQSIKHTEIFPTVQKGFFHHFVISLISSSPKQFRCFKLVLSSGNKHFLDWSAQQILLYLNSRPDSLNAYITITCIHLLDAFDFKGMKHESKINQLW